MSIYTNLEIESSTLKHFNFTEYQSVHNINIKQDARSLTILDSTGTDFTWSSLAINLVNIDGNIELCYAYQVNYQSRTEFPATSMGVEKNESSKS